MTIYEIDYKRGERDCKLGHPRSVGDSEAYNDGFEAHEIAVEILQDWGINQPIAQGVRL